MKDKKESAPLEQGFSIGDIMGMMSEQKDAREKAFSEMAAKLFDKSSLLMISRLDQTLGYYIVKHCILLQMYQLYWEKITVEVELSHTKQGWVGKPVYHLDGLPEHMTKAYKNVIDDILQITISYEGQGRKEILETMMSAEAKMVQAELMKNRGLMGKILN